MSDDESLVHEESSAGFPPQVGGWLLYFCVAFTVLRPLWFLHMLRSMTFGLNPTIFSIYLAIAMSSFLAGIVCWARSPAAFVWLRLAFGVQFIYAIVQFCLALKYWGIPLRVQWARQELTYAAVNIMQTLLMFLYFRLSKRVRNTFGSNL